MLQRLKQLAGQEIISYEIDVCDQNALKDILSDHSIDAVIHFASYKAVGESVDIPLKYYKNNLVSSINLLQLAIDHNINNFIFSSSATVYGNATEMPITEQATIQATNPYGQTKVMIEQILKDTASAYPQMSITCLRYFNPIGAHESGEIGEDPDDLPNNLMPYISQVAVGKLPKLRIFGDDYETPDGTGVRDYIHVVDLARGHVAALKHLSPGWKAYNLGTGIGHSVLDAVTTFQKVSGKSIPYEIIDRRPGDAAVCYADPSLANTALIWKAEKTFEDACTDSWRWQSKNPNGYN